MFILGLYPQDILLYRCKYSEILKKKSQNPELVPSLSTKVAQPSPAPACPLSAYSTLADCSRLNGHTAVASDISTAGPRGGGNWWFD